MTNMTPKEALLTVLAFRCDEPDHPHHGPAWANEKRLQEASDVLYAALGLNEKRGGRT